MALSNIEIGTAEAATLSGYSRGHICWLARQGKIQSRRVGERVILINKDSLVAHIEKMKSLGPQKYDPH